MNQRRVLWLDVAKGITIILMMLGHTSIPKPINSFIFSFHMPLFFMASGWCTSWNNSTLRTFTVRKIKSLVVPFVIYSFLVLLIAWIIDYDSITLLSVIKNGWQGYALWFIPVLFLALVISRIVMTVPDKKIQVILAIALMFNGTVLRYNRISLPWTLSSVPYAAFLVLIGGWLKKISFIIDKPKWWRVLLLLLITIFISQNRRLDIAWNQITPVMLLTVGAVSGTLMVFSVSSYIDRYLPMFSKIFQLIGKETFVILSFSQILGFFVQFIIPCNKIVEYIIVFMLLALFAIVKNLIKSIFNIK